jgi:hypothetical protein
MKWGGIGGRPISGGKMRLVRRLLPVIVVFMAFASMTEAQKPLPRALQNLLRRSAGSYPLDSAYAVRVDSAVLVFGDVSLTPAAVEAGTWMFGPATTKAEEDGCPPEKVLGRRLARLLWTYIGKPKELAIVTVRVRGPLVEDALGSATQISEELFYPRFQLTGPWVGDEPLSRNPKRPRAR